MLKIPPKISIVISVLESRGHQAYIVGGCVRDMLLGKTPNDFDVTTSANPDEVMEIFEKTVPTGIKHGTVTVIIEDEPVEVTTFREEFGYSDNRRPDNVAFVKSLEKDLMRRDFTVNAMAYSERDGLKDYYCGKEDLHKKILRAVGVPEERFREDALRILRLFRFASQLEFEIEENTLSSAIKMQKGLENISRERIFSELYKTACGKNPGAIKPLIESGGLEFLGIRDLPDFDLMKRHSADADLCFYLLVSASENMAGILTELKVSNKIKKLCDILISLKNCGEPFDKAGIKEMLSIAGENILRDFIEISLNDNDALIAKKIMEEILENNEPYLISHLKISGKHLLKLGISGENVGKKLEDLRKFVITYPEKNNYNDLKNYVIK